MVKAFDIASRPIGAGHPTYVIAELSANHHQEFEQAVRLVHVAREAGADAVKLQTYTPDTITIASDRECFRIASGTLWDGRTLHELYAEAFTPWEWQPKLKTLANSLGLHLFSSPFDASSVEFLANLDVPAFKISSFELVDLPLIRQVAATGKPLILSTGMATSEEIDEAIATAVSAGATQIALLKCTSAYPASHDEMNLRAIPVMAERFGYPVGLSDHTLGLAVPLAAVALGACIVEKHLTLSRTRGGPDSAFSLEPDEFRQLVVGIRAAERALGESRIAPTARESASRVLRRSLFVVSDIKKGELLTDENIRSIRPGHGLHTRHLTEVLGSRAARDVAKGTPLGWDMVAGAAPTRPFDSDRVEE